MNRNEQIKAEAKRLYEDTWDREVYLAGANWADAHPVGEVDKPTPKFADLHVGDIVRSNNNGKHYIIIDVMPDVDAVQVLSCEDNYKSIWTYRKRRLMPNRHHCALYDCGGVYQLT